MSETWSRPAWLVSMGLPKRQTIVVTGEPGAGKTILCSQIAFSLAVETDVEKRGRRSLPARAFSERSDGEAQTWRTTMASWNARWERSAWPGIYTCGGDCRVRARVIDPNPCDQLCRTGYPASALARFPHQTRHDPAAYRPRQHDPNLKKG